MYGWCDKCEAITLEGLCSKHGETRPINSINSVDLHPLPEFEKKFLNKHLDGLELGDGVFLIYGDRIRRRKVVILDKPIAEIKLKKNDFYVTPFVKGKIKGMKKEAICEANKDRIERLTKIAKTFSRWEIESNGNSSIISFSGGRDSLVLAHLLEEFGLKKVFIDTTIEFPETYEFIKQLKNKGWDIDVVKAKTNFFELCKQKGFPSYKNRWCCKTQKFEPFSSYLKENYNGGRVTVFSGVRRWES
ncbi:MAG: phosphoadenosine phosphosulfate reductase family protein, partial [Candidatus Aenigmarchaeota archaeon]|nr:phosphoadenosine phosphosulfate reductase family protein [Candidatus Aenigmarchaeota archaeon]